MAKYQQAVDVVIRGRTQNLKAAFGVANQSLTTLSSKLVRLRTMAISTFGAYTIARGLASLTAAALDFQKQMAEVHTMLRDGGERFLPEFTKQVRELSIEFGQSTDTIAKGLYDILSAGIPAEGAMKVLRASLISATGGLTDLQTAAYGATSIINAYGLAADQATHVNDLLFAVVEQGKIRFNELSSEIGKVVSVARAAGISLEDTMAMIATIVRVEEPARGITALRAAIMNAAASGKDFVEIIRSLEGATLPMIKMAGFARRAGVGVAIMTGNIDNLNKQLEIMGNVAGKSMGAANKVMQTMWFSGEQLKQLFLDLKRVMGEEVARALIDMGMGLKENREELTKLAANIGKTIGWLIDLTVRYRHFLGALIGFGVLVKIFATVAAVAKGLSTAIAILIAKKTASVAVTKAQVVATTSLTVAQLHLTRAISITTAARTAGNIQSARWASLAIGNIALTRGLATATFSLSALLNPFTIALAAITAAYVIYTSAINEAKKAQQDLVEWTEKLNRARGMIETGSEAAGWAAMEKTAIDELAKIEKELEKFSGEIIWEWKTGEAIKNEKEILLARKASLSVQRKDYETLKLKAQEQAKLKKLEDERIKAQRIAFKASALGVESAFLVKNEALLDQRRDLAIKYMQDAEQKELAMADVRYEKLREKAALAGRSLNYLEDTRLLEVQAIKDKHAKIAADKQKKEQEKLIKEQWKMEKSLMLDIGKAWINVHKKGYEARLYFIALAAQAEKEAAYKLGLNLDAIIDAKAEMLRRIAAQNAGGIAAGIRGVPLREAFMATRIPGYADPMKLLHTDNVNAQKTRGTIGRSADEWAEKIYNRLGEAEVGIFNP